MNQIPKTWQNMKPLFTSTSFSKMNTIFKKTVCVVTGVSVASFGLYGSFKAIRLLESHQGVSHEIIINIGNKEESIEQKIASMKTKRLWSDTISFFGNVFGACLLVCACRSLFHNMKSIKNSQTCFGIVGSSVAATLTLLSAFFLVAMQCSANSIYLEHRRKIGLLIAKNENVKQ